MYLHTYITIYNIIFFNYHMFVPQMLAFSSELYSGALVSLAVPLLKLRLKKCSSVVVEIYEVQY